MIRDGVPYFAFRSNLEFEKKTYHLSIILFYNNKANRKEYEVTSNEFSGPAKRLVHTTLNESPEKEWMDIDNHDDSLLVQEIGAVIYRHNV